jgi:hypothetical protein
MHAGQAGAWLHGPRMRIAGECIMWLRSQLRLQAPRIGNAIGPNLGLRPLFSLALPRRALPAWGGLGVKPRF